MKAKKLVALLLAVLMLFSLCSFASAQQAMTPGTYRTSIRGYSTDVVVDVTVDETSILSIDIVKSTETPLVGGAALTRNAAEMVKHQSTVVDEVTGATVSAAALRYTVTQAIKEAGGDPNDFSADCRTPAKPTVAGDFADFDADVIVIGGGLAGMTAAMNIAQQGVKVVIFEQDNRVGGNGQYSGGNIIGAGTYSQRVYGIEDSADMFYEDLLTLCSSGEYFRPELAREFADESGASLDQIADWGVIFGAPMQGPPSAFGNHASSDTSRIIGPADGSGGLGLIEKLRVPLQELIDKGLIALQLNSKVTDLITENGAVVGVEVTPRNEEAYIYRAPVTIIASGGYANNAELRARSFTRSGCSSADCSTGTMLLIAESIGAATTGWGADSPGPGMLDTLDSGSDMVQYEVNYSNPGYIWMDKHAQRLENETSSIAANKNAVWARAEDNTVYIMLTQEMVDTTEQPVLNLGGYAKRQNDTGNVMLAQLAEESKVVFKADTVKELAEKAGMDPQALQATVDRYNGFCDAGIDADFGRDKNLIKFENGPFYMIRTIPSVKSTSAGVVVDLDMHVLDTDGNVIPGLYACGEFTGTTTVFGRETIGGSGLGQACVFGRIAGLNAAGDIIRAAQK